MLTIFNRRGKLLKGLNSLKGIGAKTTGIKHSYNFSPIGRTTITIVTHPGTIDYQQFWLNW